MKVLICASARAEVVIKCVKEFSPQADITIVAPSTVFHGLRELSDLPQVSMLSLKAAGFGGDREQVWDSLKKIRFDAVIVVSGGLGFNGFHNVIRGIAGLRFTELVFYNQIGRKETIRVRTGGARSLERCAVSFLSALFQLIRPMELLIEGIYIQCAELLGL